MSSLLYNVLFIGVSGVMTFEMTLDDIKKLAAQYHIPKYQ